MKRLFIIFILFAGCSMNTDKLENNFSDIKFTDDMSFEEFQNKLKEYAENSPYPNIDN
ncbi:hypothetical protein [Candidatus Pelagibacter communis]|uniref:hypothetical protein n=1 Tax=Candidatus Pelagibacter TaxID=198251 RepID=UPI003EE3BE1A